MVLFSIRYANSTYEDCDKKLDYKKKNHWKPLLLIIILGINLTK